MHLKRRSNAWTQVIFAYIDTGASIPLRPQFDLFQKNYRFSSAKISDDLFLFLVIAHKFGIPLFSLFQFIFPHFGKFFFSPLILQISP